LFSLQAALAKRDVPKSMEILSHVKNNMTLNPLPLVLATFFSFFRKVAILHSLRGQTDKEMMAALGIQFYFLSEYKFAARSFNPQQIERIVEIIHHADLRFKGIMESSGSEANLLEETIVRILNVN
jgi:DNA polymerase-3 subunit delta